MPQLNQLAEAAYSQFFWLLLVLGVIYFGIGKMMLPKIQSTVDAREKRITGDLEAAQAAREAADATEAAYRAKMDESRAEAVRIAAESKAASAKKAEDRLHKANAKSAAKIEEAEARIRAAADAALADVEKVAAEAAQDIVKRLAGTNVSAADAAKAVKAAIHG